MQRRKVLQTLSVSLGSLLVSPAWAKNWREQDLILNKPIFTPNQEELLTEIVSTIIPEGKIVGAASLGVPVFIQKMLADCYEKDVQDSFKNGLLTIEKQAQETYKQSFKQLPTASRIALLNTFQNSAIKEHKDFFTLLKNLTIQGYTSSEYVMVNHWEYEMAPGHFHGCVNV